MEIKNPRIILPLLITYFPEVGLFEKILGSMDDNPVSITCKIARQKTMWECFNAHKLFIDQKQGDAINSCAVNFGDMHMLVAIYSNGELLLRKQFEKVTEYVQTRNNLLLAVN